MDRDEEERNPKSPIYINPVRVNVGFLWALGMRRDFKCPSLKMTLFLESDFS